MAMIYADKYTIFIQKAAPALAVAGRPLPPINISAQEKWVLVEEIDDFCIGNAWNPHSTGANQEFYTRFQDFYDELFLHQCLFSSLTVQQRSDFVLAITAVHFKS